MDSNVYDDSSNESINSFFCRDEAYLTQYEIKEDETIIEKRDISVVNKLFNRQLYGRFAKNPRAKTEKIYEKIPESCNRLLSDVLPECNNDLAMQHVYMGFTICGQYLLSYTWNTREDLHSLQMYTYIYYLFVWRYVPGKRLQLVSKHKIFRHYRPLYMLDVTFSQWPTDRNKIVAYGVNLSHPSDAYITVVYLPATKFCEECSISSKEEDSSVHCLKHSVTIDFMLSTTSPFPVYNPMLLLAFPDHIVINTGHYVHIININNITPTPPHFPPLIPAPPAQATFDTLSETSEPELENLTSIRPQNIVQEILQDFSEYDLDSNDCSKPFHELNISCEPLNVTGKNYFNTNHNGCKILQNNAHSSAQKTPTAVAVSAQIKNDTVLLKEKSKIDKKIAEKAYEFTEDTEKCEKLSSFRKKRLADKKYEFSEDNSENIIPFQLLRQERRYLLRNQNRMIRSPDYFRSPQGLRSPRSPILSPNYRPAGQSSSSPRNIYCPSLRMSPANSCRSPISPRDATRKFTVYSPSYVDSVSDCSDCNESSTKLVLKHALTKHSPTVGRLLDLQQCLSDSRHLQSQGLLIVDGKKLQAEVEKPRWIRKVEKRYCNLDFESSSLVSDAQSRDEYLCSDLPTWVHTANNNQVDIVPSRVSDEVIGHHLKITQKTFDCEQFCQRRAEKLCADNQLKFSHCEDYDIKIQHICPLSGDIICTAWIKIGAVKETKNESVIASQLYVTNCIFVWNICTDSYKVMESTHEPFLSQVKEQDCCDSSVSLTEHLPQIHCKKVRYMVHNFEQSLQYLRDSDNYIQLSMDFHDHNVLNYADIRTPSPYISSSDQSDSDELIF